MLALAPAILAADGLTQSDVPHLNAWPAGVPSPDFRLRDTHGAARTMRSFAGFVTLVEFGYANCPGPCSLQLQKAASAVRALGARRAGVRVVFITLDPQRDSSASLQRFVHSFDSAFVALRGTVAQTDAAAKLFSIEDARVPAADGSYLIDHTIEEFMFDRAGRLRLLGAADTTAQEIAQGLSELLQPSISKARAATN